MSQPEPGSFADALDVADCERAHRELLIALEGAKNWLPVSDYYRILDHLNAVASDLIGDAFERKHG